VPWTIAPIAVDDADDVARVHVRVWQEAYAGLMPADYLESLEELVRVSERSDVEEETTAGI